MKIFSEVIFQMAEALDESFMKEYECYFGTTSMKECNEFLNSSVINEYPNKEREVLLWCKAVFNASYSEIADAYSDYEIIGIENISVKDSCVKSYLSDLHAIVNSLSFKMRVDEFDIDYFYNYVCSITDAQENYDLLVK